MTNIEAFKASETKRSQLAALLDDPILKEAIKVIEDSRIPKEVPIAPPGVPYSEYIAHKYRELQGGIAAIRDLKNLVYPNPVNTPQTKSDPYLESLKGQASAKYPALFQE